MRALIQRLAAEASEVALGAQGAQGVQPAPGPWSTVMVVGAGGCSEWGLLRRLQAQRLVLVEPQQRLADDLLRLTRGDPCAEVWPLALVPQGDEATLLLLNMARESGTAAPAALSVHYPRAGVAQRQTVPARPIEQALHSLTLDPEQRHLLVLDVPGQALSLLQAAPAPLLQAFETVIVRMGVEALYESDADALAVSAYLESVGFEAREEDPEAIFPHTAWRYARNVQHVQLLNLQDQSRKTQALMNAAQDQLAEQTRALSELQAEIDWQRQLVRTLEAEQLAAKNVLADLTAERDALRVDNAELTQQLDGAASRHKVLETEKAELMAEQHALAAEHAALNDERNALAAQRDGMLRERADLKADVEALTQDKASLTRRAEDAQAQLAAVRQENRDLSLRQELMQEELVKAEAQIDLIKDLLLRELSL